MSHRRKEKFDFEVSHFQVIPLVLVGFIEFIHINEVVMWFIIIIILIKIKIIIIITK